jgi:hypothetical protein
MRISRTCLRLLVIPHTGLDPQGLVQTSGSTIGNTLTGARVSACSIAIPYEGLARGANETETPTTGPAASVERAGWNRPLGGSALSPHRSDRAGQAVVDTAKRGPGARRSRTGNNAVRPFDDSPAGESSQAGGRFGGISLRQVEPPIFRYRLHSLAFVGEFAHAPLELRHGALNLNTW